MQLHEINVWNAGSPTYGRDTATYMADTTYGKCLCSILSVSESEFWNSSMFPPGLETPELFPFWWLHDNDDLSVLQLKRPVLDLAFLIRTKWYPPLSVFAQKVKQEEATVSWRLKIAGGELLELGCMSNGLPLAVYLRWQRWPLPRGEYQYH